jgi:hypothetical protein
MVKRFRSRCPPADQVGRPTTGSRAKSGQYATRYDSRRRRREHEPYRSAEMAHFNKDIALAGAALMLFAFFAHVDTLGLTITGPLFKLG